MAGGSHIVSIGAGGQDLRQDTSELVLTDEVADQGDQDWSEAAPRPPRAWQPALFAAMMIGLIAAWTGYFGWVHRASALDSASLIGLIRDWSTPVVLLCIVWLMVSRTSTREATRFGNAAQRLDAEAAQLEVRLITVNRELSLAREFIAAQSRDIEALGRITVERIAEHAERLSGLIRDNSARIETIGTVSVTALDNMEKLRGQLPVIASSAKDVTNNIASAGRSARDQLDQLVSGFSRLNEFGQASEHQVETVKARVEAAMGQFTVLTEHLDSFASERFAALTERGEEFRLQLDRHEVEALAAIRTRAGQLSEELEQTRATLDRHEEESLTSLRARLSAVRDEGAAIGRAMRDGEAHALDAWRAAVAKLSTDLAATTAELDAADERAQSALQSRMAGIANEIAQADARLAEHGQQQSAQLDARQAAARDHLDQTVALLDRQLDELDARIASRQSEHERRAAQLAESAQASTDRLAALTAQIHEIADHGRATEQGLAAALQALAERLHASRDALTGTDAAVAALTDASVRLLELIQASARHTAHDLPQAMGAGEAKLFEFEQRTGALNARIIEAQEGGALLAGQIETAHGGLAAALSDLDRLHRVLADHDQRHSAALAGLREQLAATGEHSAAIADQTDGQLRAAIDQLRHSAREAVAELESLGGVKIAALAEQLGKQSRRAIDDALSTQGSEAAQKLEAAVTRATAAGSDAASQLRDQLAAIEELTGNLEQRVAETRERAESKVDNDFARRAALITETLNSNAIDIARALDSDVADTAWSSYLRGDRGIFTRRATRLLEAGAAREVAQLYETDRGFRDHVAQYVHDFEAMLRELLSTRDGHALSVTLLSSDMGKLYVALAQAIQRLRD